VQSTGRADGLALGEALVLVDGLPVDALGVGVAADPLGEVDGAVAGACVPQPASTRADRQATSAKRRGRKEVTRPVNPVPRRSPIRRARVTGPQPG